MRLNRSRRFVAVLALVLMAATAFAQTATADPVSFGNRTLQIPAPQGNQPVSQDLPVFFETIGKYVPTSNRLVQVYLPHQRMIELALGTVKSPDRYFSLQVMRLFDGERIALSEFAAGKPQIMKSLEGSQPVLQHEVNRSVQAGNQQLQKLTGKDPAVSVTSTSSMGEFRDEPWGLFYTSSLTARAANGAAVPMVFSMAIVWVDGQLLYLYAHANDDGHDSRQWTQHGVSQWADAIRAANPI